MPWWMKIILGILIIDFIYVALVLRNAKEEDE